MPQTPPTSNAPTAAQEWRANWLLVLSALAGLSFGAVPTATLGLFMEPLSEEFGWTRTQISSGLSIFALVAIPLTPFAGMAVDRFGPRRVALPGIALCGIVFAAFSLQGGSIVQWLASWIALMLASLLTRTLVWNSAVSTAFSTSRGMAIAALLSGYGIATAMVPTIAHTLIETAGWRGAYIWLGLGWCGFALLLLIPFFHVRRPTPQASADQEGPKIVPGGLTVKQALRSAPMLRIALAVFLQTTLAVSLAVHLVPLLTSTGLSRAEAAGMAAVMGAGSMSAKVITGWLVDRTASALLPMIAFSAPALTFFLLLESAGSHIVTTLAMFVMGCSAGASLHLTTYMTTRYVGMRNFGAIFGLVSSAMSMSSAIGPVLAGSIFDRTGSYDMLLMAGIPLSLIAGLAVFRLGPYPVFQPQRIAEEDRAPVGEARPA